MAEDFKCNVLIMGKTGTGKSTLLNYLCDSRIAETGSGKPVTGEGIYEYPVTINGQEVRVFDSWGIEAGKVERWKSLIDQSLKEHGVQKRMEDWFHSVIYCIQAGGGRIEEIDTEIIRRFLVDGYLLTVVLTKADQVDEQDEQQMRKVLLNDLKSYIPSSGRGKINIISTCAEKKKTRAGETIPFGKEEVQKAILEGWKETVLERLPKHVVAWLIALVEEWRDNELDFVANSEISGNPDGNVSIYSTINSSAAALNLSQECKDYMKELITSCHKADAAIRKTFQIDIKPKLPDRKPNDRSNWWKSVVEMLASLFKKMKSHSPKHIKEERHQIEEYIRQIADNLILDCKRLEPSIVEELDGVL